MRAFTRYRFAESTQLSTLLTQKPCVEQEGKFSRRPAARSNALSSIVVVSISKHISSSEANVNFRGFGIIFFSDCMQLAEGVGALIIGGIFGGHLYPYFLRMAPEAKTVRTYYIPHLISNNCLLYTKGPISKDNTSSEANVLHY